MTALFNPSPLVLGTLQNLSLILDRSTAMSRGSGVAGLAVGRSETRAFGGLDMAMSRTGQSTPTKARYGAITVAPRVQGSAYSKSPGVHPAIDRAYENPGVRFGDRVKGGERPTSAGGETSCHFSQTSVSKTSPIREMIKAARSGRRLTGSRAAAHVLYVEREGAPEQIKKRGEERLRGEDFTAEIERRGKDRSAVAQQAYIERAGAAEGMERKPGRRITDEELNTLDEASFGTIGNTVEERTRFWLAVEEAEATPKGDRITIKPADNPEWWAKVAEAVHTVPAGAQKVIADALARNDGEPFEVKLPTDKAFALHQWAVELDTEAPLEISPGRGGRTQTRVIAELPHELDGRERLQIVRDFTQKLAEKGFPYWAVIHAPDANNDARNYHVHIAYYDRPAGKISPPGGKDFWDFEIEDYVTYKSANGGAKRHLTRPHQQNRLRETNNQEWVTELRKHWEMVSNRVLEEAGVSKRYNLGTYESMGIELEPLKHINSRTFNKERKGELTEEGPVLARRQWDNVHDRLVKDHEGKARKREKSIEGLAEHAGRVARTVPGSAKKTGEIGRLKELGVKASFQLALLELHQDLTRLVVDRIASRPKLMMTAADKEETKTGKKKGMAEDLPPRDGPVAGASLFGLSLRSEVVTFLTKIYDGGLRLDRENGMRADIARNNVRVIVQELRERIANPSYPARPGGSLANAVLYDLDSDERLKMRAERQASLGEQIRTASEQSREQVVAAIEVTLKSAPVPELHATVIPPSPPAMPAPRADRPRYQPGRRDTAMNAGRSPPARPSPPITLPAGYGPQGRSSGAPTTVVQPGEALTVPRPIMPMSDERRPVVSQSPPASAMWEVLRKRQTIEADPPNPSPTSFTNTVQSDSQIPRSSAQTEAAAAASLPAAVATAHPGGDATPSAQADRAGVPPGMPTNAMPAAPTRPPVEDAAAGPVAMPSTTLAPTVQPPPLTKPAVSVPAAVADSAQGTPLAQRGTANRASAKVAKSVPARPSARSEHPVAIPDLAEIMDARDRAERVRPSTTRVEIEKPESALSQQVRLPTPITPELRIKGAKRPEKKRRERDRGHER